MQKNVVLSWPYKDCILEGGQTKEDVRNEEVFLNETLSPGDIAKFLSPKVFTNFSKYSNRGAEKIDEIKKTDNLLIRGDNLLVLHSIKEKFAGKIKLIYLDPPYNTESDYFRYNDSFNQSTWLTFMRNRIDVAKELLSSDGFLFVHISFHQYAYLKVLLDEVFNGNHVCTFNLLVRHPDRILKADKDFHDVVEYLLVYTRDKAANKIAKRSGTSNIDNYLYRVQELNAGNVTEVNGISLNYFLPGEYRIIKEKPSSDNLQKISIRGSLKEGNSSGRFYENYLAPIKSQFPPNTIFKIPGIGNDKYDHRYFYTPEKGNKNGGYFQGLPLSEKRSNGKPYPNFLDFVKEFNGVGYEGGVEFRNGKKPEALIKLVFELGKVQQGDIVLDFFGGSGTTVAVAHKMGFQYIAIEQMDYGKNDPLQRLHAVINGEQTGVSKTNGWKGGGSFVFCELAKLNTWLLTQIQQASQEEDIDILFKKIIANSCIHTECSLQEKKEFMIDLLGKKPFYLNYHDMEDSDFSIAEDVKIINHRFYDLKQ